jgi:Cu/Ag efflux protein CusF
MLRRSFVVAAVAMMVVWGAQSFAGDEQPGTHEGKVVKAEVGKLTMTDKDGKNEHTHMIGPDAKITVDGKESKLTDLKAGYPVKVIIEKQGDKNVVTKVEATKA